MSVCSERWVQGLLTTFCAWVAGGHGDFQVEAEQNVDFGVFG
jgi:hypothetical protein